jgi:hypothetical protein
MDSKNYKTCDMYMTASLRSAGCELEEYRLSNGRVYFTLVYKGTGGVQGLVDCYLSGKLSVDALTLVNHVKALKTLCGEVTGNSRGN